MKKQDFRSPLTVEDLHSIFEVTNYGRLSEIERPAQLCLMHRKRNEDNELPRPETKAYIVKIQ